MELSLCCRAILGFGVTVQIVCNDAYFSFLSYHKTAKSMFSSYVACNFFYHGSLFSYPLQCCWNGNNLLDTTVQPFNVILPIQDISDIKAAH